MLPWIKSVFNDVIEAGAELANEFEPKDDTEEIDKKRYSGVLKRDRSKSQPVPAANNTAYDDKTVNRTSSQEQIDVEKKNIFDGVDPINLGVTPLLTEYVTNLCQIPETWIDFPIEEVLKQKLKKTDAEIQIEIDSFSMTDKQEAHAVAALREIPQLDEIRYQLVPRQISDERFWQIYFLLVSNKFQLSDSDENFRMPDLQKSDDSLLYNSFYMSYGSNQTSSSSNSNKRNSSSNNDFINKDSSEKRFTFARKNSECLSVAHPPTLINEQHPVFWWHANERGSRNASYLKTFLHDSHGKQGSTSNWEKIKPSLLKQDRPKVFKLLLRCGVPDDFRNKAWKSSPSLSICIKQEETKTPRRFQIGRKTSTKIENTIEPFQYEKLLIEIFGNEVPLSCDPIPSFGGNLSFHQKHYLSQNGTLVCRRILILIALYKPHLHFAPILTDLSMFLKKKTINTYLFFLIII